MERRRRQLHWLQQEVPILVRRRLFHQSGLGVVTFQLHDCTCKLKPNYSDIPHTRDIYIYMSYHMHERERETRKRRGPQTQDSVEASILARFAVNDALYGHLLS